MSWKASGFKAWAWQRATAVYIGLFGLYLIISLLFAAPENYTAWQAWFAGPVMQITSLLFVLAILLHAWVGIRDICIDYVKPIAVRAGLLMLLALSLILYGLWAAQLLLR
ncbi:MAG: succinate dehydrogenase, hydrophobic membrane anchor protein [Pseudomonadota bacterium]